jgi:hypothetical protein
LIFCDPGFSFLFSQIIRFLSNLTCFFSRIKILFSFDGGFSFWMDIFDYSILLLLSSLTFQNHIINNSFRINSRAPSKCNSSFIWHNRPFRFNLSWMLCPKEIKGSWLKKSSIIIYEITIVNLIEINKELISLFFNSICWKMNSSDRLFTFSCSIIFCECPFSRSNNISVILRLIFCSFICYLAHMGISEEIPEFGFSFFDGSFNFLSCHSSFGHSMFDSLHINSINSCS